MNAADVCFDLNGQPARHDGAPERRLLEILREDHGLTGASPGARWAAAAPAWSGSTTSR